MNACTSHCFAALAAATALCSAIGNPLGASADNDAATLQAATPGAHSARTDAARQRAAAPDRAPFMLSPFGPVSAPTPESLPDDPAVRTRNGLYATRAQAQALDASAGGDSVWVDVDVREPSAIDLAEGHVAGMMAANNLAADAPVFVTGNDAAAAARGVDRLSAQGLTRVFLVTR